MHSNHTLNDILHQLPPLPSAAKISAPPRAFQPNLWRNDFVNGTGQYVFWQFNPLSIDVEYADGTTANLCDSAAQGGLQAPGACTVIADTGYSFVVANNGTALQTIVAATVPGSTQCGVTLWGARGLNGGGGGVGHHVAPTRRRQHNRPPPFFQKNSQAAHQSRRHDVAVHRNPVVVRNGRQLRRHHQPKHVCADDEQNRVWRRADQAPAVPAAELASWPSFYNWAYRAAGTSPQP
jgi:hypothetical protein